MDKIKSKLAELKTKPGKSNFLDLSNQQCVFLPFSVLKEGRTFWRTSRAKWQIKSNRSRASRTKIGMDTHRRQVFFSYFKQLSMSSFKWPFALSQMTHDITSFTLSQKFHYTQHKYLWISELFLIIQSQSSFVNSLFLYSQSSIFDVLVFQIKFLEFKPVASSGVRYLGMSKQAEGPKISARAPLCLLAFN